MKKITQKKLKKELIKTINKSKIVEVNYETKYPEFFKYYRDENGYTFEETGSIITIRTLK